MRWSSALSHCTPKKWRGRTVLQTADTLKMNMSDKLFHMTSQTIFNCEYSVWLTMILLQF
jgi:sulfur transfer protein SufE